MAAIDKIRWMRLINELTFLHEEIDLVDSIINTTNKEFQEYYEDFCKINDLNVEQLNSDNSERVSKAYDKQQPNEQLIDNFEPNQDKQELTIYTGEREETSQPSEYEMTQDEKQMHETFTKLFRALALKLHPDKLDSTLTDEQKSDMINMFNKAKLSLDERKYFILLELAKKFNIKTPKNYKQQIRWMKKELEMLKEKAAMKKNSYSYAFSECENDEQRDNLIKKFITQLFGIIL